MAKTPRTREPKKRIRRDPEQAKRLILDAAVRTLSERGSACGLREIASAAGVSHALVTHYFGTHEKLVEAAVEEAMSQVRERLIARLVKLADDATPERMVQTYLDIALEPWHGRLLSWAVLNDQEASAPLLRHLVPQMRLMVAATERAFSKRRDPPDRETSEALLVCIWSTVVGYVAGHTFFWSALGRKPGPSRDRAVRDVLAMMARSLST